MNSFIVHSTLMLATVLACGCYADSESSIGYELLAGRIDHLERTVQQSLQSVILELQALKRIQNTATMQDEKFLQELQILNGVPSCRKILWKKSGIYKLKLMDTAFDVYCEQNLYGGGWIVIQNRFNDSVDFFRDWIDYRNGFGTLDGEFWLGLEKIHLLTSSRTHQLIVHLEDPRGGTKYALYENFKLSGQQDEYTLEELGEYSGTAGDSLDDHLGNNFSTRDRDNDNESTRNLAAEFRAGWWFDIYNNLYSNLNGMYNSAESKDTMNWFHFKQQNQQHEIKVSKIMIREV